MSSISGRTKHSGQVLGLDPSAQSTTIIHYRKPLCHSRLELKQCVKQKEPQSSTTANHYVTLGSN